jgi:hypothetical protein
VLKSVGEPKLRPGRNEVSRKPVVALDHALELRIPGRGQPDPGGKVPAEPVTIPV